MRLVVDKRGRCSPWPWVWNMDRTLAVREGIFAGLSSGAAVAGALEVASTLDSGTVVTIIPDRGDRYLSTMLFRSVCAKCPP